MCLLLLCATEWSLFSFLSVLTNDAWLKTFLDNLTFIGVVFTPVSWFIFSIHYTRQDKFLFKKFHLLLSIIPIISLILLFTNSTSNLLIEGRRIVNLSGSTFHIIEYDFGPWFWVHTIYTYSLMFLGMIVLMKSLIRNVKVYRNQAIIMISAVLIPFVGAWIYLLNIGPIKGLDTTTFSFTIGGLLLFIGMFRYKLLDLVPIAREAVIETMSDLVIVLDNQNRIIDINNAARNVFYIEQGYFIGQPILKFLKQHNLMYLAEYDWTETKNEIVLNIDGNQKYYNIKYTPLINKKNTAIGSFVVLNDITNLKEAMTKLESSKLAAESANKAKSEFLATMSHEIRTPLNGIIGMSELLENANLTAQERENLKALQYSADSLLYIINEILDFSKIEAGKMLIDNSVFDIREVISNISKTYNYHRKNEAVKLICNINEQVPKTLVGDYIKLGQILNNLISNAFKFTEVGEIKVNVDCLHYNSKTAQLAFSVIDTGIGIPQDKIGHLFQSFHQLDSSTTRKYGGTGLGLSIVKKLVELMKGSIRVESSVGKGSSFFFELPFAIQDKPALAEEAATLSNCAEEKPLNILIADDSKINQLFITQLLQRRGWTADVAENGIEAVEKARAKEYDLILMDIQMPKMDGYEAAQAIREIEKDVKLHVPIIALTANASLEDRNQSLESGMDDFLSKPIKADKLYECILKHI